MPSPAFSRRSALAAGAAAAGALAAGPAFAAPQEGAAPTSAKGGRLKQSVCKWCFREMSLDELCTLGKELGLVGVDLLKPGQDFETLKKHGMVCTMTGSHALTDGLCEPKFHDACLAALEESIKATAAEGWRNVITFSGNARGMDRNTGLENCAKALEQIVPLAEKHDVVIQMELLNSKVNHPDYMCDTSEWGVKLVDKVASDNFKLLYDIYHMQIMEGDIIRTIKTHKDAFGHYHTAGNPGRNELDGTQELQYRPIAEAIAETGFDGYFAHEFIPKNDPVKSLTEAVQLCTV
ncbi:hydroxypyruvate isomerase family protein [Alienimonas californiensis]|uniref:Hydroxypyruvate isomerase n=1 Tax=Alienimonas californiensis TaxID=2527989 RepID=A0A517P5B2_9PLAN|nr:TIM barrel protein [Alienimonas californiensis]QDT14546.1 Hydroxypyruvate isomerase [Alienimonas californiensis]